MSEAIAQAIRLVLADIDDAAPLTDYEYTPQRLHDLLAAYQVLAAYETRLPVLTLASTGSELKRAMGELETGQALMLLLEYAAKRRAGELPQTLRSVHLEHQIYVLTVVLTVFIAIVTAGTVIILLVDVGLITPTAVLGDLFSTAREAMKLLLGIQ